MNTFLRSHLTVHYVGVLTCCVLAVLMIPLSLTIGWSNGGEALGLLLVGAVIGALAVFFACSVGKIVPGFSWLVVLILLVLLKGMVAKGMHNAEISKIHVSFETRTYTEEAADEDEAIVAVARDEARKFINEQSWSDSDKANALQFARECANHNYVALVRAKENGVCGYKADDTPKMNADIMSGADIIKAILAHRNFMGS